MDRRSPIERMIDEACGIPDGPPEPPPEFNVRRIVEDVIGHIDTMYPGMWKGVPKTARTSLRGCIHNSVSAELKRTVPR